jgi:hypothetical protein
MMKSPEERERLTVSRIKTTLWGVAYVIALLVALVLTAELL